MRVGVEVLAKRLPQWIKRWGLWGRWGWNVKEENGRWKEGGEEEKGKEDEKFQNISKYKACEYCEGNVWITVGHIKCNRKGGRRSLRNYQWVKMKLDLKTLIRRVLNRLCRTFSDGFLQIVQSGDFAFGRFIGADPRFGRRRGWRGRGWLRLRHGRFSTPDVDFLLTTSCN